MKKTKKILVGAGATPVVKQQQPKRSTRDELWGHGNALDASAPLVRRGKEKEQPKKKKPTALRRVREIEMGGASGCSGAALWGGWGYLFCLGVVGIFAFYLRVGSLVKLESGWGLTCSKYVHVEGGVMPFMWPFSISIWRKNLLKWNVSLSTVT